MKALRELHDFIAGGSIVAPVGLVVALGVGAATAGLDPAMRTSLFFCVLVGTFVASAFERPG